MMKDLSEYINEQLICEHFVTIFTKKGNDVDQVKDEVYALLCKSYAPIGGLLGCNSAEELVKDTDIWKLVRKEGKIVAALTYSTKRGGRKTVFGGTDGTSTGKLWLYKIIKEDIKMLDRDAWQEVSGKMEHIYLKHGAKAVPVEIAKAIMKDKEFTKIHDDGFHYERIIGGVPVTKMLVAGDIPEKYKQKD